MKLRFRRGKGVSLSHVALVIYLDNEILNVPIHERDTVASVIHIFQLNALN